MKTNEQIKMMLTHIAHEAVGQKNARSFANYAIESGLLPILEDKLNYVDNSGILDDQWNTCLDKLGKRIESLEGDTISNLNSIYNIEGVPTDHSKTSRGIFVEVNKNILSNEKKFLSVFGPHIKNLNELVKEEFVFKGNDKERQEVICSSKFGWLEIGASCDHAQLKNKFYRYLLGMMIPVQFKEKLSSTTMRQDRAHEGIYRSPEMSFKDGRYVLFLSFRYQIGVHSDSELLGEPLFRMKDQILNEIAFNWSKHSIRPGITSFR